MDAENALLDEKSISQESEDKITPSTKGAFPLGRAVLFVGIGIALLAKDEIEKFFKAAYEKGAAYYEGSPAATNGARSSKKVKVPILPINNYNRLNPDQIIQNLEGLSPSQLQLVRDFEGSNKNRKRILQAIEKRLGKND